MQRRIIFIKYIHVSPAIYIMSHYMFVYVSQVLFSLCHTQSYLILLFLLLSYLILYLSTISIYLLVINEVVSCYWHSSQMSASAYCHSAMPHVVWIKSFKLLSYLVRHNTIIFVLSYLILKRTFLIEQQLQC